MDNNKQPHEEAAAAPSAPSAPFLSYQSAAYPEASKDADYASNYGFQAVNLSSASPPAIDHDEPKVGLFTGMFGKSSKSASIPASASSVEQGYQAIDSDEKQSPGAAPQALGAMARFKALFQPSSAAPSSNYSSFGSYSSSPAPASASVSRSRFPLNIFESSSPLAITTSLVFFIPLVLYLLLWAVFPLDPLEVDYQLAGLELSKFFGLIAFGVVFSFALIALLWYFTLKRQVSIFTIEFTVSVLVLSYMSFILPLTDNKDRSIYYAFLIGADSYSSTVIAALFFLVFRLLFQLKLARKPERSVPEDSLQLAIAISDSSIFKFTLCAACMQILLSLFFGGILLRASGRFPFVVASMFVFAYFSQFLAQLVTAYATARLNSVVRARHARNTQQGAPIVLEPASTLLLRIIRNNGPSLSVASLALDVSRFIRFVLDFFRNWHVSASRQHYLLVPFAILSDKINSAFNKYAILLLISPPSVPAAASSSPSSSADVEEASSSASAGAQPNPKANEAAIIRGEDTDIEEADSIIDASSNADRRLRSAHFYPVLNADWTAFRLTLLTLTISAFSAYLSMQLWKKEAPIRGLVFSYVFASSLFLARIAFSFFDTATTTILHIYAVEPSVVNEAGKIKQVARADEDGLDNKNIEADTSLFNGSALEAATRFLQKPPRNEDEVDLQIEATVVGRSFRLHESAQSLSQTPASKAKRQDRILPVSGSSSPALPSSLLAYDVERSDSMRTRRPIIPTIGGQSAFLLEDDKQ